MEIKATYIKVIFCGSFSSETDKFPAADSIVINIKFLYNYIIYYTEVPSLIRRYHKYFLTEKSICVRYEKVFQVEKSYDIR